MKISKTSLHYRFNNFMQSGDFRSRARAVKNYVSPEPNVFIQAIADKHNKFCTRVEVV